MSIHEYIDQAIREGKDITIKYVKYDGEVSTRTLSNVQYSDEFGSEYIKGFCHLRQEDRTFKISRIRSVDGVTGFSSGPSHISTKTAFGTTPTPTSTTATPRPSTPPAHTGTTYTPRPSSTSSQSSSSSYRTTERSSSSYSSTPRSTYTPPTKKQSEGCYIATMAYGDYDHPQVMILRKFRDEQLLPKHLGRAFVKFYYWISPKLVKVLKGHERINKSIRGLLDKFINKHLINS